MKTFRIEFKHIVEEFYFAEVEAETQEEAEEKFDSDPFGYVTSDEPNDVQGLDIEIENIEQK